MVTQQQQEPKSSSGKQLRRTMTRFLRIWILQKQIFLQEFRQPMERLQTTALQKPLRLH
jgi:hypothetical protein